MLILQLVPCLSQKYRPKLVKSINFLEFHDYWSPIPLVSLLFPGGAVAQSVERATPGEEVVGSTGWVSVSIM